MNMNISCSVPGCTEPVIGQCQGYNVSCGRFYCRVHSKDKLCDECATIREAEVLYKQYDNYGIYVRGSHGKRALQFLGIGIISIILGIIMAIIIQNQIGFFFSWIILFIAISFINAGQKRRYREICMKVPDFEAFYKVWNKQKTSEAMGIVVGIAAATVIVGVASAFDRTAKIERDISDIKNKVNRLNM